jgi:hypothetical protein
MDLPSAAGVGFWLGVHQPHWLAVTDVPLFVSHRRLASYRRLPRARAPWALDSGGFSELSLFGEWRTSAEEYVAAVRRYDQEIGRLCWAATQDWMCEPHMVERTGLSVYEHQVRTVENYARCEQLWYSDTDDDSPFILPLQGDTLADYAACWLLYEQYGINPSRAFLVGLGSVCRRQATAEIGEIVTMLRGHDPDLPLHGFGVKTQGLHRYGHLLSSADSMAWSFAARRLQRPAGVPGCTGTHKNCANCLPYALAWRTRLLTNLATAEQPALFDTPHPGAGS